MALAASGEPDRFLTLTVNPSVGASPEERRAALAKGFNHLLKRMRRRWPERNFQFLTVVEKTKAGEPHLHVLLRGGYVPQKWISEQMRDLIDAPIVDIRAIKSMQQVVTYVAKYIAKAPAQFATFKRYWSSRAYEIDKPDEFKKDPKKPSRWHFVRQSLDEILKEWFAAGFITQSWTADAVYGRFRTGPPPW